MAYVQTDGIVLREIPYLESDKLLVVLTSALGKVTVRARGARQRGSKLLAASQLLVFSHMTLFDHRGKHMLDEAEVCDTFFAMRKDIEKLSLASYFSELVETMADEEVPSPELLRLLLNASYALCKLSKPLGQVKAAFELKALCIAGYQPELSVCAGCGGEPSYWKLHQGLAYCRRCAEGEGAARALDSVCLNALDHIIASDQRKLYAFTVPDDLLHDLGELVEDYLLAQLDHRFPTLDFYKKL